MANSKKQYYIGARYNPQLPKPYYVRYGQLSKAKVKEKESPIYGSMYLTGYSSEAEYLAKIEDLKSQGFRVN